MRFAAGYIIILLATVICALLLVDGILGRPVPDLITNLIYAMATPALAWISQERGVTLTNGDTAQALKTLAAHVNATIPPPTEGGN